MASRIIALLFTDLEGSTRLWDEDPGRMRLAVQRHYEIAARVVAAHRGTIDSTAGDSMLAIFDDPLDAVLAATTLQRSLDEVERDIGIALRMRCGVHAAADERHGAVFLGHDGNRAARVMTAAHGGQIVLTDVAAELVRRRLPAPLDLLDLGRVRLRDLSRPERIHQVTAPFLREHFPPPRGLEGSPNNIPFEATPLIGRDAELAELRMRIAATRLLTLLGPGGIGKTRMALQLAAAEIERFSDGVWFVDLAVIGDPALVAQAVASVLGIPDDPAASPRQSVLRHVRDLRLMLVLDNCEHLVDECASFVLDLLRTGRHAVVCATSREPLRVPGETTWMVPALAVPPPDARDAEGIARFDAVRLFVERARRASPAFAWSPRNAAAIAEIVRRLDGIPLAIELAAARVGTLGVAGIASGLQDRFRLLTHGTRTALPRQQTLSALIGWSHELLAPAERLLFRRLSAFAGSWDLSGATAIANAAGRDTVPVLDALTALVEKSLVVADPEVGRYRMLESIWEFARVELERSDEAEAVRNAHLAFCLEIARQGKAGLSGPSQRDVLLRLDAERDNLLAAQAWCDRAPNGVEQGLELAHAIKLYWFKRGLLHIGCRFTEQAVARAAGQPPSVLRSRGLFDAGQFCSYMGRYRQARIYLEESLAIARQMNDRARVAAALQPLGLAALGDGDANAARRYLDEALALAREDGDQRFVLGAVSLVAMVRRLDADLHAAGDLYAEMLRIADDLGDEESSAIAHICLAILAVERDDVTEASRLLASALALIEQTGSRSAGQSAIEAAVGLAARKQEWSSAARLFGAAERLARESGGQRDPADADYLARQVARARGALPAETFAAAQREGEALDHARALEACARVCSPTTGGRANPG